jgi:adenosylcobyric acid synthase
MRAFVESEGRIGGICGGYQMLGKTILDPHGVEGAPGRIEGFGLLSVATTLTQEKVLTRTRGVWTANGQVVAGYEIHMGFTEPLENLEPAIRADSGGFEGACRPDGRVWGTYLHGLFDTMSFRRAFLEDLSPDRYAQTDHEHTIDEYKDRQYDLLAEHFETHLDMNTLMQILES